MSDLITRIKLEIKHTRDGHIDCAATKRRNSAKKRSKRCMNQSHDVGDLSVRELKMNQAKIFQATNKLEGITDRISAENNTLAADIEKVKQEIEKLAKQTGKVSINTGSYYLFSNWSE